MSRPRGSHSWLLAGYIVIIVFTWLAEILDLPHVLMGMESTPTDWAQASLETGFILIISTFSWMAINYYERGWKEANAELKKLASTDSLTGALSRREFLLMAEEEFVRSKRFKRPLACGIIDFDDFKFINDNFGHLAGDKVLSEFTRIAMNHIRQQDFIGRLGGDEFAIAFVETTTEDARVIMRRIQEQWNQTNLISEGHIKLNAGFSAGIASVNIEDQTLTDCIRRTDKALYKAKERGKSRIEIL